MNAELVPTLGVLLFFVFLGTEKISLPQLASKVRSMRAFMSLSALFMPHLEFKTYRSYRAKLHESLEYWTKVLEKTFIAAKNSWDNSTFSTG